MTEVLNHKDLMPLLFYAPFHGMNSPSHTPVTPVSLGRGSWRGIVLFFRRLDSGGHRGRRLVGLRLCQEIFIGRAVDVPDGEKQRRHDGADDHAHSPEER